MYTDSICIYTQCKYICIYKTLCKLTVGGFNPETILVKSDYLLS